MCQKTNSNITSLCLSARAFFMKKMGDTTTKIGGKHGIKN